MLTTSFRDTVLGTLGGYIGLIGARRMNAIEIGPFKQPVDEWLSARRTGQLVNSEWGEE